MGPDSPLKTGEGRTAWGQLPKAPSAPAPAPIFLILVAMES